MGVILRKEIKILREIWITENQGLPREKQRSASEDPPDDLRKRTVDRDQSQRTVQKRNLQKQRVILVSVLDKNHDLEKDLRENLGNILDRNQEIERDRDRQEGRQGDLIPMIAQKTNVGIGHDQNKDKAVPRKNTNIGLNRKICTTKAKMSKYFITKLKINQFYMTFVCIAVPYKYLKF